MELIDKSAKIAQEIIDKEVASDPRLKTVLSIVKDFISTNKVLCYGGTAINNLLPPKDRFYDPSKDVPDYDFFSMTPQIHSVKLANDIAKAGYKNIEVKPGMHLGTFKVFADYIGVADISFLDKPIFEKLWDEGIEKGGIHYVSPNFLRMSIYLELSRPRGFVERWKKVYSRLLLLNKEYPIKCKGDHSKVDFVSKDIQDKVEDVLVKEKVILLGFNASMLQSNKQTHWSLPIDVLATPDKYEETISKFHKIFDNAHVKEYPAYAELLPEHTDIKTKEIVVRVFKTDACHSYHETKSGLYIASIPTLLQFFLSTIYADKKFLGDFPEDRYICTAQKLVELANDSSSRRYKLLTPVTCLGTQKSLVDMRVEKSDLYTKLSKNKSSPEYLKYFFQYNPLTKTRKNLTSLRKTLRH